MWRHRAKTTTWGCTLKNQPNATSVKVRPRGCFCSVDLIHDPMTTVIIAVNTNIALMIEYMTWIIHHKSDILNESCNRQYCRCRTVDVASVHEDMILAYHSWGGQHLWNTYIWLSSSFFYGANSSASHAYVMYLIWRMHEYEVTKINIHVWQKCLTTNHHLTLSKWGILSTLLIFIHIYMHRLP